MNFSVFYFGRSIFQRIAVDFNQFFAASDCQIIYQRINFNRKSVVQNNIIVICLKRCRFFVQHFIFTGERYLICFVCFTFCSHAHTRSGTVRIHDMETTGCFRLITPFRNDPARSVVRLGNIIGFAVIFIHRSDEFRSLTIFQCKPSVRSGHSRIYILIVDVIEIVSCI